jgi:hypothetical protein
MITITTNTETMRNTIVAYVVRSDFDFFNAPNKPNSDVRATMRPRPENNMDT